MSMRLTTLICMAMVVTACSREQPVAAKSSSQDSTSSPTLQITEPTPKAYVEPVVGGASMSVGNSLIDNLSASKDHTRFVAAIKAAGMLEILRGPGPLTVFAPTNVAFDALPDGELERLMQPRAREDLAALLAYHIVPGRLDGPGMQTLILAGNGSAKLETVEGSTITAAVGNGEATIVDAHKNSARVSVASVVNTNGVMHVIDRVLTP